MPKDNMSLPTIAAKDEENSQVVSFSSDQVVTSSNYQQYEDDNWILTVGGNNNAVGVSTTYASRATLGEFINVIAFNKEISPTSKYLSAVISKSPLKNVTSLKIGRSGTSMGAYKGTKVYLTAASRLEDDFELVMTIDEVNTSVIEYSVPPVNEEQYYALVFYNPNGSFLLGNVTVDLYCTKEVEKFIKVEASQDLYFGATYTFVSEEHGRVIGELEEERYFNSVEVAIANNSFAFDPLINSFTLDYGIIIDTYSLKFNLDRYISLMDDKLKEEPIKDRGTAFLLEFIATKFSLYNIDKNKSIFFNENGHQFEIGESNTNLSLYILNRSIDWLKEASTLVDAVLNEGEHAYGKCEETYNFLNNIHDRLSEQGRNQFISTMDVRYVEAKRRLDYLKDWTNSNKEQPHHHTASREQNSDDGFIVFMLTLCSIELYIVTKKKK